MQSLSFNPGAYTPRTTSAKSAAKSSTQSKEDFSSHFSSPDDITIIHGTGGKTACESLSPYLRLLGQYDRWKAQLPEDEAAGLPDSTGLTEENIAYLKERYSGELTWMEREDALNTMEKMGIISNPQKFSAHSGGGWVCRAVGTEAQQQAELEKLRQHFNRHDPMERDWNVLFEDTPIAGFLTIDDILSWVERLGKTTADPLRCRVFDVSMDASMIGVAKSK